MMNRMPRRPGVAVLWIGLVLCATLFVTPAYAQLGPIEPIPAAEELFEQGLTAFEDGDYGVAERYFSQVYEDYPLHRRTTAAMLMAGKALYRLGSYPEAAAVLEDLTSTYPSSRYIGPAQQTLEYARLLQDAAAREARVVQMGIILPLEGDDALISQPFFNGVRLAVEEHNRTTTRPIQMVFRPSSAQPSETQAAIRALADDGVNLIIGPIFTEEAVAAARAADRADVVLLVPLDADEAVTRNRRSVFQINPTFTMRGRIMARFATRSLRMNRFAVFAEQGNSFSERMAEGFQDEALRQGADVLGYHLVPSSRAWGQLSALSGADTLAQADGVFLPIASQNLVAVADAALGSLRQMNLGTSAASPLDPRVRVLGNEGWHDLPLRQQASTFLTTYSVPFHVNPRNEESQAFRAAYRDLTGEAPRERAERLAYTGYDVARFAAGLLDAAEGQWTTEVVRTAPLYEGLGVHIDFDGGNVNQASHYFRYRLGDVEPLR